jgi:phosphatidate cytidylyltransferase
MNTLTKRTLSSLVFGPVILITAWFGGIWLQLLIWTVVILGIIEFSRLIETCKNIKLYTILLAIIGIGITGFVSFYQLSPSIVYCYFFSILIILGFDALAGRFNHSLERISYSMFALVYIPLIEFLYLIRILENGRAYLLILVILIWITDTAAYFIGAKWGKHKGVLNVSKNKSIEGFVSGIVAAFLFAYVLNILATTLSSSYRFTGYTVLAYGIIVGVFGQLGDLIESALKRDCNVKDASNFIPGHGGILDRFDSMLISGPLLYFSLTVLGI